MGKFRQVKIQIQIARNAILLKMHSTSRMMHKKRQKILLFHANARIDRAKTRPYFLDCSTIRTHQLPQITK